MTNRTLSDNNSYTIDGLLFLCDHYLILFFSLLTPSSLHKPVSFGLELSGLWAKLLIPYFQNDSVLTYNDRMVAIFVNSLCYVFTGFLKIVQIIGELL